MTIRKPEIDDHYRDPRTNRIVKVLRVTPAGVEVETVRAADDAVTERAVGKITHMSMGSLSKFHFEPNPVLD